MAESELHKKLKNKAVSYLFNKGYRVARAEVKDHYYGIVDAWGVHYQNLYTMGIEVKVSRSDWQAAKHKDRRLETVREEQYGNYGSRIRYRRGINEQVQTEDY